MYWSNLLQKNLNARRRPDNVHFLFFESLTLYSLQGTNFSFQPVVECGKVQLVGLAVIVFIEQASVAEFRGFQIVKAKTAIKGLAGNKGALLCRFE